MQDYTFNGRVKPKQEKPNMLQLVELPHKRKAFVYQRLSSHEQVKKSIFSIQMQDSLEELAIEDGYTTSLSKAEVQSIRSDSDYLGYYINGQIIVEQRDLGVSGTLGPEKREGLAHLIQLIEKTTIESIYVVHISRLFRDQTLIDGLGFGELCKKHNVVLVMPNMRLNLNDKMHMRIYRIELERSADELEIMNLRMGGAKQLKAKNGLYASGKVPIGYVLGRDRSDNMYDKYIAFEPHAKIIRKIFELMPDMNFSPLLVARRLLVDNIQLPFFPPELEYMQNRSCIKQMKKKETGYQITPFFISRVVTNPAYIGWWIWGGEVLNKDNHPKIVDENLFWKIQERLSSKLRKGKAIYLEPKILEDILYCCRHDTPRRISSDHVKNRYRCQSDYRSDPNPHYCFGVADRILDDPICEFVVSQCSYPEYAEKIVRYLKRDYQDAKDKAETRKRELAQLVSEIERLKDNLAYTKTPQQVEMILEMIEERRKEKERLSLVTAYPAGRIGGTINIEKIANFLRDMKNVWKNQPARFKNEFLRIVIDKVLVIVDGMKINVRIVWKTGLEQEISIVRPPASAVTERRWTKHEMEIVKKNYPSGRWDDIFNMLPERTYTSIINFAYENGLKRTENKTHQKSKPWTNVEDMVVEKVASGEIRFADAISHLQRTPNDIYNRMLKLGLESKYKKRDRIKWNIINLSDAFSKVQFKETVQAIAEVKKYLE